MSDLEHTPLLESAKLEIKVQDGKNEEEEEEMLSNYDQILEHIGDMGKWQFVSVAVLWLPSLAAGIIVLLLSFTALEPRSFRCALEECDGDLARYVDINETQYFAAKHLVSSQDYCTKPNLNGTTIMAQNCSLLPQFDDYVVCTSEQRILYDYFEFEETIATEFKLVCDQQYKVALVGTMYMVGLLIGSFLGGMPADVFGRKPVLFGFVFVGGVGNLVGALVSNYWFYAFFRLLAGVGEQGLTQVSFTLSVELVGANYQSLVGNGNQAAFALGTCITGLLAYFVRDWRNLHFATSGLIIPQILLWWFIPESPRWLITSQKWTKLAPILKSCLQMNRVVLPTNLVVPKATTRGHTNTYTQQQPSEMKFEEHLGWKDMFVQKALCPRSLIMMTNWGVVALVYYGISMSMTQLGGDIFVNFILAAVAEILGYVLNMAVSDHWGRKPTLVLGFLVSGICCVCAGLIPSNLSQPVETVRLVLLLVGKLGCSAAFATAYVYTAELFPTPIRNTAVGTCSMVSRLVSISAPFLTLYLPDVTFAQLPFIIFGVAALIGTIVSVFLPESLGHPLPDNLKEAANMGGKPFWSCWSNKRLQEEVDRQRHELSLSHWI